MEDPLSPFEIEDKSPRANANFCELTVVKKMLAKLERAEMGHLTKKSSKIQLEQIAPSLLQLTDEMAKFHRSFQKMQSWQGHLTSTYWKLQGLK